MKPLVLVVALAAALLAAVLPAAAWGHGSEGGSITSTVDRVEPEVGVRARASGDGHLTLIVPRGVTVLVRGTGEEPDRRFADGAVLERAATRWRRIGTGTSATWHDHRIHFEGELPAVVGREPRRRHDLASWRIGGTADGRPFMIHGTLAWQPKRSGPGYEWISYVALGGGAFYIAALVVARRRVGR